MQTIINNEFNEHLKTSQATMNSLKESLENAAILCINSLNNNGKIILFGNGGSAADAQHIAAELVGRYKSERKSLSAIALTTDTSVLTAISNDYGFDKVFERQVEGLAKPGDIVIAISTSGNSINVLNGLTLAKDKDCKTIGFSGNSGGNMTELCDINLAVPNKDTPRIQEMHILLGHILCHLIEQNHDTTK